MAQQIQFSLTLLVSSVLQPVTTALPNAVQGQAYSFQLQVTGGTPPYSFSASGLPMGIVCSVMGLLSGTPATAGSFSPLITVTDSGT